MSTQQGRMVLESSDHIITIDWALAICLYSPKNKLDFLCQSQHFNIINANKTILYFLHILFWRLKG